MNSLLVLFVFWSAILQLVVPQYVRVVEVPQAGNPRVVRNFNSTGFSTANNRWQTSDQTVIFEFLKPKGLGIYIPGPYPPSFQYRLKFHLNLNKPFDGWKAGDWNGVVTLRSGAQWRYSFPQMTIRQGDTIHYWIEAEGADWEKGYKGKYEVTQNPHGSSGDGDRWGDAGCARVSATVFSSGRPACSGEPMIRSYTRVAPRYMRPGADFFMESTKQIGGLEPEESFTIFTKQNIFWNDTHTVFVPSLLEDKYGPSAVDMTNFTLKECSSSVKDLCESGAMGYLILPPILSGRHSTKQSFSFQYGVLEVTARLPRGDWIVPELWLLPKDQAYGNSSGKIILAMSRGNMELSDALQDYSNRVLEAGVQTTNGSKMFRKSSQRPWSSDYHRFKLIWTQDKMEFFVDDEEIGTITPGEAGLDPSLNGSKMAPFDKEFYLVFGLHVGGDKDFPDSVSNKPWKNFEPKNKLKFWRDRRQWQRTWGDYSPFYIKGLSLTALNT